MNLIDKGNELPLIGKLFYQTFPFYLHPNFVHIHAIYSIVQALCVCHHRFASQLLGFSLHPSLLAGSRTPYESIRICLKWAQLVRSKRRTGFGGLFRKIAAHQPATVCVCENIPSLFEDTCRLPNEGVNQVRLRCRIRWYMPSYTRIRTSSCQPVNIQYDSLLVQGAAGSSSTQEYTAVSPYAYVHVMYIFDVSCPVSCSCCPVCCSCAIVSLTEGCQGIVGIKLALCSSNFC